MCGGGSKPAPPPPPPKAVTRASRVPTNTGTTDNAGWRATLLTGEGQEGSLGLSDEELNKSDRSLLG